MSSYIPPYRRNIINNFKDIPKIKSMNEEFPLLVNDKPKTNQEIEKQEVKKSFVEIFEKDEEKEKILDTLNKMKAGWCIIEKNENCKIVITDSEKTKEQRKKLQQIEKFKDNNNYFYNVNKMINNWNNFRDNENELSGDLSPYNNYKEEIEKMRLEDLKIEEKMEEFYRNSQTNSDSENDESNI
jgi:hypothetical protein